MSGARAASAALRMALVLVASLAPCARAGAAADSAATPVWTGEASALGYFVADGRDYVQPTVWADRGPLHLEARWNYEVLDSGSLWAGWTWSFGGEPSLDLTPMAGVVFGDASGVAPGLELTLAWPRVELYSEDEYVFDSESHENDYFYSWTQLTYAPAEWWRFGLVGQRTRAYASELDFQRGPLLELSRERLEFTFAVFNPARDDATVVAGVTVSF